MRSAYFGIFENPAEAFGTGAGEGLDPTNDERFDAVAERNGVSEPITIGGRQLASGTKKVRVSRCSHCCSYYARCVVLLSLLPTTISHMVLMLRLWLQALEPKTFDDKPFGKLATCVSVTVAEAADDGNNLLDFLGEVNFLKILDDYQHFAVQIGAAKELHDHDFLNEIHAETGDLVPSRFDDVSEYLRSRRDFAFSVFSV